MMKIWIATGGTGGHVFPALSVADEFARRGNRVTISCDGRVREMVRHDGPRGAAYVHIWASGVGAKSKFQQIISLFKIAMSAFALSLRFMVLRPDRVVAFGGYASVPVCAAAALWRVPIFLHEQNAAIGRANRFTMRWVKTLMTSFERVSGVPENTRARVVFTGLPVRAAFIAKSGTPVPHDNHILVTGGSLGAKILDDVVPVAVAAMKNKKIFVTHQTRPENVARLQKFYADNKIRANVLSFIHDMADAIAGADLIIGRAGASTVIEIETIGRGAILVPLNINPDQIANANDFAHRGGGYAVAQEKFTPRWLTSTLNELFENPSRLAKMAQKSYAENTAVAKICDTVITNG